MLAQWYPNDKERGTAMSIAFAGTGFGVIVGPIFGGFFYQYFGKTVPFLIIAGFALFDGGMYICIPILLAEEFQFYTNSYLARGKNTCLNTYEQVNLSNRGC